MKCINLSTNPVHRCSLVSMLLKKKFLVSPIFGSIVGSSIVIAFNERKPTQNRDFLLSRCTITGDQLNLESHGSTTPDESIS